MPALPKLPSKAKFWKKRSANISDYDPTFRVIYLGNVLTGWAKGEGCVDKPLATLWKNHTSTDKPNIVMKVTVCASGLKAVTKEHGLTEYWAHRVTFCDAEPSYPKVFCWIYRHEGRKMKQELRCHAVLCPSENKARLMAKRLRERLHQALVDFKKEKVWKQNARLSLANAADDQPTMPFRKMMLGTGSANYRPPLEKGKSAPKLKVIEEVILEEDEELEQQEEVKSHRLVSSTISDPVKHQSDSGGAFSTTPTNISSSSQSSSFCNSRLSLTTSETFPLLINQERPRCTSSLSADNLSIVTGDTVIDAEEDDEDSSNYGKVNHQLIVISDNPSPLIRRPRPTKRTSIQTHPDLLQRLSDDNDSSDDEVTDYLEHLSLGGASVLKSGREEEEANKTEPVTTLLGSEEEEDDGPPATRSKNNSGSAGSDPSSPLVKTTRLSEQDTISDESGYSEESNHSAKEVAATIFINGDVLDHSGGNNKDNDCDLTVRGVLISEFSPTEQLRYLQRSRSSNQRSSGDHQQEQQEQHQSEHNKNHHRTVTPDFLQNKVPEFCINI